MDATAMNEQTKERIAQEKAKDFCEKHGLREHFIEDDLRRAIQSAIEKASEPESAAVDSQEWTVERSKPGVSNPMSRIVQGDQAIIGWTMRPYSESFDKIADAHNASIAAEREKREQVFLHLTTSCMQRRELTQQLLVAQEELKNERLKQSSQTRALQR